MRESSPLNFGRTFLLLGRLGLGAIFVYAGYVKLALPGMSPRPPLGVALALFAMQIDSYQLLPFWAVNSLAHTLPFVELALGLLLVTGLQVRWVASFSSLLLAGFFAVMVRTYAKGLEINCGCFGPGEALGVKTLIRDGLLLTLAVGVAFAAFRAKRAPHPWGAPLEGSPVK
ncbi:MAG TPA: MauE/DoxX family redox-associated membrane protein [Candidatus Acidoferrales bacterium]|nr:MauE/DoxX family redox-associated membrane protein [Candidatus Acidoferrales bacterium]HYL95095.1 MauE/DoxX family redox-associated membrane protein [Terriglobales bacterium]